MDHLHNIFSITNSTFVAFLLKMVDVTNTQGVSSFTLLKANDFAVFYRTGKSFNPVEILSSLNTFIGNRHGSFSYHNEYDLYKSQNKKNNSEKELKHKLRICCVENPLDTITFSSAYLTNIDQIISDFNTISGDNLFDMYNTNANKNIQDYQEIKSWFDPLVNNSILNWIVSTFEKKILSNWVKHKNNVSYSPLPTQLRINLEDIWESFEEPNKFKLIDEALNEIENYSQECFKNNFNFISSKLDEKYRFLTNNETIFKLLLGFRGYKISDSGYIKNDLKRKILHLYYEKGTLVFIRECITPNFFKCVNPEQFVMNLLFQKLENIYKMSFLNELTNEPKIQKSKKKKNKKKKNKKLECSLELNNNFNQNNHSMDLNNKQYDSDILKPLLTDYDGIDVKYNNNKNDITINDFNNEDLNVIINREILTKDNMIDEKIESQINLIDDKNNKLNKNLIENNKIESTIINKTKKHKKNKKSNKCKTLPILTLNREIPIVPILENNLEIIKKEPQITNNLKINNSIYKYNNQKNSYVFENSNDNYRNHHNLKNNNNERIINRNNIKSKDRLSNSIKTNKIMNKKSNSITLNMDEKSTNINDSMSIITDSEINVSMKTKNLSNDKYSEKNKQKSYKTDNVNNIKLSKIKKISHWNEINEVDLKLNSVQISNHDNKITKDVLCGKSMHSSNSDFSISKQSDKSIYNKNINKVSNNNSYPKQTAEITNTNTKLEIYSKNYYINTINDSTKYIFHHPIYLPFYHKNLSVEEALTTKVMYEVLSDDLKNKIDLIIQESNYITNNKILILERIEFLIQKSFKNVNLNANFFGSIETNLVTKYSDVDIFISGSGNQSKNNVISMLETLGYNAKICEFVKDIKQIFSATVPVLKLVIDLSIPFMSYDVTSEKVLLNVDIIIPISENNYLENTAVRTTSFIKNIVQKYNTFYINYLFIKYLLSIYGFTNTYEGILIRRY